ncbi:MAG: hypothetical protein PHN57_01000 [Candidatus Omnitrophica bacterium]|nr:hypothetical protein [Candidatus Omnitrophota bacterium]
MKIKRLPALIFCFLLFTGTAFCAGPDSVIDDINGFFKKIDLTQHGSLKNETAYRIHTPTELTKVRNQFMLTETGALSENTKFKITSRFYYDAVYDLTDNFPSNVRSDQAREAELRDTYIDYSKGPFDMRLGKQQIVWGEAVGLFFADVVNARDLREFVLPDFDMIRIPQWGADLEYGKGNFHIEGIWIPGIEFDKRGVTGSEFAFPLPVPENTLFTAKDPQRPKSNFQNSETGMRMSYLTHGWDVSAFYLYTWEKSPVMFRSIDSGVFNFHPGYRRLNIVGSTFAKEINDVVLKGEFVFNRKGNFSIFDSTNPDGVTRKDFIDYLLGLDYTFWKKIDANFQFMQRVIFNFDNRIVNEDHVHNAVSLRLSKGFLNDSLETEFLVIAGLMREDLMYRPKVTYSFKNNWKLRLGLDIFQGKPSGVFGMFEKKSRTYCELTYSF